MQKIIEVFRVQRHDFINHLQVISGFLQLGKIERANEYIAKVSQDVAIEGLITRLVYPELVAVLLIKKMEALHQAVNFQWEANTDLSQVELSDQIPELVDFILQRVLEDVMEQTALQKEISISITEEGQQCLFKINWSPGNLSNPGFNEKLTQKAQKCGCRLQFSAAGVEATVLLFLKG